MNEFERPEKAVPGTRYYEIPGPNDPPEAFTVVYDSEKGEVVTRGFGIDAAITVRESMVDEAVRHAAVVELERLGYRVLPPEGYEVEMQWASAEKGYEGQGVEWEVFRARGSAEFEVDRSKAAGYDCYLVSREVVYGQWREVQS